MAIQAWFPTFIYYDELKKGSTARLNAELKSECYTFADIDEEGRRWSRRHYLGGYTSYASLNDLHKRSPTFEALKAHLDRHVARFARHLEMDLQGGCLELSTLWINIMPCHTTHSGHIHPLSAISGTYYVSCPEGGGPLKFEDPRLASFMAAPPKKERCRPENRRFVNLQPEEGKIVLFESWVRHEVPPNAGTQDRVSVSFNYDWV